MSRSLARFALITAAVALIGFVSGWLYQTWVQPAHEVAQAETVLKNASKRIVYLHGADYPDLVAQAASESVAAVTSSEALKRLDAVQPLDAIIFDAGLRGQLDPEWLQAKYRAGVVIGAVGMTVGQLTQFIYVPTPSVYQDSVTLKEPIPNVAVIQLQITASNDRDVEQFWAQYATGIDNEGTGETIIPGIESTLQIVAAQVNYDLSDTSSRSKLFSLMRSNVIPAHINR
ncbi:MAG: hypothetical protein RMK99_15235 [Anaerolineales bacterium]|nr:hypothetical protein [Anaerolineales bacterium]